jgi:hypothetical protein
MKTIGPTVNLHSVKSWNQKLKTNRSWKPDSKNHGFHNKAMSPELEKLIWKRIKKPYLDKRRLFNVDVCLQLAMEEYNKALKNVKTKGGFSLYLEAGSNISRRHIILLTANHI